LTGARRASNVTPHVTPACIIWNVTIRNHGEVAYLSVYFKHEDEARGPAFANQFLLLLN